MKLQIDSLEPVVLNGVTEWIRIRTEDTNNPVLLLMQQGPGLPIINEARHFRDKLRLEQAFTVVYWDQRGTGLSSNPLRQGARRFNITVTDMVEDTVALLEILASRFGAKAIIVGFSFGATFAAYAASKRPDLVSMLIAVGMDIDTPAAERHTYQFVLAAARDQNNRRAQRQLEAIGPPPHVAIAQFRTRARWAYNFGGITVNATLGSATRSLLTSLVLSPDYGPVDLLRAARGITASQSALLPELANTNLTRDLPRIDVPVTMIQGRHDQVAPAAAAQQFFDTLTAPTKHLEWFEESAHTPHLDEPTKFRELLMSVPEQRSRRDSLRCD